VRLPLPFHAGKLARYTRLLAFVVVARHAAVRKIVLAGAQRCDEIPLPLAFRSWLMWILEQVNNVIIAGSDENEF
jgi:hypothetical protein